MPDQEVRVTILMGTAVECDDFHGFSPTESIRPSIISEVSII